MDRPAFHLRASLRAPAFGALLAPAFGALLAAGAAQAAVAAQTAAPLAVAAPTGRIDVHAIACAGDPQTPVIRARNLRRDAGHASPEFVRTGDGTLRMPPGYYDVWAQTDRCFARAFVAVVAGQRRNVTPSLGPDVRLDGSMAFAGSVAAAGAMLSLADYDRPSLTYALDVERDEFYANLAPKRYVLTVTQSDGTASRFGVDLGDGAPGDLATMEIGVADLAAHRNYTGPLFARIDDIAVASGRTWYVDSGRGIVGWFARDGEAADVRVDVLRARAEIRSDGAGGVWAYDVRANDVVHVDARGVTRVVHLPARDNADDGLATAAVAADGGLVVVRDRLQTLYHVALDGTIAAVQLRPGYDARNFGVDGSGAIVFADTGNDAPVARYSDGSVGYVAATTTGRLAPGVAIVADAFARGRFSGGADARFGLRDTYASATTASAVRDGARGYWTVDCNERSIAHVRSDRSRLSYPLAGDCPTSLAAGPSGVWLADGSQTIRHVAPDGTESDVALVWPAIGVRGDTMHVATDGTLWFVERNPNRIAYVDGSRIIDLPLFAPAGPQATVLR